MRLIRMQQIILPQLFANAAAEAGSFDWKIILWVGLGLVVLLVLVFFLSFAGTWLRALAARAHVSFWQLLGMSLRRVPADLVVSARITAIKAGLQVDTDELEGHHLAGGNIVATVKALIAAEKAGIPLSWEKACAIDLSTRGTGKSVLDAVHAAVNPQVIDCPDPRSGRTSVDGVAKDGIQVKVKTRVTVRTSLDRFIRGAQEETIVARVGEGIVSTIGGADSYKTILENPENISKTVLARHLDAGTAFDIISIDIADVEVGRNVGAELQAHQAEADKNTAQAQAEARRAAAVAAEQENRAKERKMRALVVEHEAQVPLAIADALRLGRLGVLDVERLENLKADTRMRAGLVAPAKASGDPGFE
ncbi:MAG: flotillin-like protein FloA [Puniceicoccales bacterium]|nr:flotillin-like protein FloA [Puniceicoccales bacterium]